MPPKTTARSSPVGKRIKKTRTTKKITLDQMANDTGCSTDYLKKIESGGEMPPVGTLLLIARALHIDSGELLRDRQADRDARVKAYTKRTQNYAYTTLTPGAENKHLKAFLVAIDPLQAHEGVGYRHEGEEFIYVVKGAVEVTVGDHVNRLKKGDSLHFNSGIQHLMRNTGRQAAELLVVIYNP
jgi:quercetin dioxygenase-like cupin family protein